MKKYIAGIIFVLIILVILPFLGITDIKINSIFKNIDNNTESYIFWYLRVPRTLLGFLAGSILAIAGLIFQNIFKNSLATPYTLGISSGASAGVVIAIKLGLSISFLGLNGTYFYGFIGAFLSILFILTIAKLVRSFSIYTLLMTGVAVNFFFSSLIVILHYLFDFSQTVSILRWLMGGITPTGYKQILFLTPFFICFIGFTFLTKNQLLIASGGDNFAYSKGLNIKYFRILVFIVTSLIIGIIVSIVGPIGFIGLVIPHISRIFFKRDFNAVIFMSIIMGGTLLLITDFISRILIPPVEIPVGIITSLIGAPFFLFVLISSLRNINN